MMRDCDNKIKRTLIMIVIFSRSRLKSKCDFVTYIPVYKPKETIK